jgi:hypothetical protein
MVHMQLHSPCVAAVTQFHCLCDVDARSCGATRSDIAMALMIVSPFLCGAAAPLSPAPAAEPDEEAPAKGQIMRSAYGKPDFPPF